MAFKPPAGTVVFTKIFAEFPSSRQIEGRNLSEKDQEVSNSEVSSKRVTKSECCNIQEKVEENSDIINIP